MQSPDRWGEKRTEDWREQLAQARSKSAELQEALQAQTDALEMLFCTVAVLDATFFASKSAAWGAYQQGKRVLEAEQHAGRAADA